MLQPHQRSTSSDRRSRTPSAAPHGGHRSSSSQSSSSAVAVHPPPNPYQVIVHRLEAEEKKLRKHIAEAPVHPNALLNYCASSVTVATALAAEANTAPASTRSLVLSSRANNALSTAHLIACRVEALLRHGAHERRRYNHEDFLNLCRDFVHEAPKEAHAAVEHARRQLLSNALQLIARICALTGNASDSKSAFEDSWAVCGRSSATCDVASLINYLSICKDMNAVEAIWLSSNAVWLAREAVQDTIHETEVLLRRGPPSDREAALTRRREYGRMLVTAMVRQCSAAVGLTRAVKATSTDGGRRRLVAALNTWRSHRTTLLHASLEHVAAEELDAAQDAQLVKMVHDAVDAWSRTLVMWGASESPLHSMSQKDRWTYQTYQSRQYAALEMDSEWRSTINGSSDGLLQVIADFTCRAPSLQAIGTRYPFAVGVEMVVAASRGQESHELVPIKGTSVERQASITQREAQPPIGGDSGKRIIIDAMPVAAATTSRAIARQSPASFTKTSQSPEFHDLDSNYNDVGASRHGVQAADGHSLEGIVAMPSMLLRSLRQQPGTEPTPIDDAGKHHQHRQSSAALRTFTDRAFDLFHQYRPPASRSSSASNAVLTHVEPGGGSLPESRAPSPLPPPQPVAPIRQLAAHYEGKTAALLSSVNSSSAQSMSSSFLLRSDDAAAPFVPQQRLVEEVSVSRDLFRMGTSVSPDPMPLTLAIPLAEAPSPAAALPRRRQPPHERQ